jgi:isocitrate/isopropylmalate dehydrogenase
MALRLLQSAGNGLSKNVAAAAKTALERAGVKVDLVSLDKADSIESVANEKNLLAAPLAFEHQLALANYFGLHTKVINSAAARKFRGKDNQDINIIAVLSLLHRLQATSSKINSANILGSSSFADAGRRAQALRGDVSNTLRKTVELGLKIASEQKAEAVPVTVVTKPQTKSRATDDKQLFELAEQVQERNQTKQGYDKVALSEKPTGYVYNQLLVYPEKLGVLLVPPEEFSTTIGDIVLGVSGGKGVTPVQYVGDNVTVFTAATSTSGNPTALLLSAADLLEKQGQTDAANKVRSEAGKAPAAAGKA